MESVDLQPEPEPCVVHDIKFLRAMRTARLEMIEITKDVLAPKPPLLHVVQPCESGQSEYQRTYVDDHSY